MSPPGKLVQCTVCGDAHLCTGGNSPSPGTRAARIEQLDGATDMSGASAASGGSEAPDNSVNK